MPNQTEPQCCYPAEVATLHELLDESKKMLDLYERERGGGYKQRWHLKQLASYRARVEALKTAIEALGGAL